MRRQVVAERQLVEDLPVYLCTQVYMMSADTVRLLSEIKPSWRTGDRSV